MSLSDDDVCSVVIDNGSGVLKAGFAGDDEPRITFAAMIGKPKYQRLLPLEGKDSYIGDDAQRFRGLLSLRYPIEHGIVTNWDHMEQIWEHTFYYHLRCLPEEIATIFTDVAMNPKGHREKMAQIMFEKYNSLGFHVATQGVLTHHTGGRTTSMAVNVGDGVIDVVPVYEGYVIQKATQRLNYAGRDLTHFMMKLLKESDYSFVTTAEREIVRDIKENLCYVASDFDKEMLSATGSSTIDQTYRLPDKQEITVGNARFRVPETLFQPSLFGLDQPSIQELIYKSIMTCDIDLRANLCVNIMLAGGTTDMPGFADRLEKEVSALVPSSLKVRVVARPERKHSAWIGGSFMASLSLFGQRWITKQEYEEHGPRIVHKICVN